jgi:N-dimethylarginine dimethylaminohydrolase
MWLSSPEVTYGWFAALTERAGVEVIQVDFSESHKFAIAGLHCATLELVRDQPGPLLA